MIDWGKSLILYLVTILGIIRDEAKQIAPHLTPNAGNEMFPNEGKDWSATTRQALADPETEEGTSIPKFETDGRSRTTRDTNPMSDQGSVISQR
jgi:hypothetical protein